uniref:Uncharacterized protein n=1 Tax=Trypanosoma congolense (strain IL3000) TaxID=1068625 RepID=G0UPR0_TRYCI|nr:hypothetical protein, unlikely [Trypanosoma congolense IL3000]
MPQIWNKELPRNQRLRVAQSDCDPLLTSRFSRSAANSRWSISFVLTTNERDYIHTRIYQVIQFNLLTLCATWYPWRGEDKQAHPQERKSTATPSTLVNQRTNAA